MNARICIKQGREKPILNRHPWIFSGAIEQVKGELKSGDLVAVETHRGEFLARGYWNARSQIQVRLLTWQDEPIDEHWWRRMLRQAIEGRAAYNEQQRSLTHPDGYRLVNAENDYLPGLIVDRYGDFLVLQALTLHIDQNKPLIGRLLVEVLDTLGMPVKGIYERSDVDVRRKEGLDLHEGLLWGLEPPELISTQKGEWVRLVDVRNGHKTGYYLDQLPNQDMLAAFLSSVGLFDTGVRLLNLFSYTGGFGLGVAGNVINVDSSYGALALAEKTYLMNGVPEERAEFIQADVFDYLRDAAAEGEQFDAVVLDPPKFAHNQQQVDKAARGYKDLNLHAFKLLKPGGYLMTYSCSGAVSADLFQKIVFGALADSGRQAQILRHLGPGDDHPVALTFPEGAYLKGLLCRVY